METQPSSSSADAPKTAFSALAAAGAAALLASACCLGPLILVLAGVSGAWIGQLAGFEPYQPIFLAAAFLALVFAGRKIWSAPVCDDGRPCAVPAAKRVQKVLFATLVGFLALIVGFPFLAPVFY